VFLARFKRLPIAALLVAAPAKVSAQVALGASGILLGTVAAPGVDDRTLAEGYLTQPMLMGMFSTRGGMFVADLTANFEGITLERGELNAGVHGEGYVDRRHPHTYVHEAVVTWTLGKGATRFSASAGKGFVPFGTDDPMSRPFVKYPVNHHLAQLLERALISGAVATGPLVVEVATFNGDEPDSPSDMPNWDRFGDSWAARLTARNERGIELQASMARVESPEQPHGGGLDHRMSSVSARFESGGRYALAEFARTKQGEGASTSFTFDSFLAEGSVNVKRVTFSGRAERTERPEEERGLNLFRTPRPHSDLSIIGQTRWDVLSASASTTFARRSLKAAPFIEISTQHPRSITSPSVFDPATFYGASRLWSFSLGVRLGAGMTHNRMGRYGVAAAHKMEMSMPGMEHMHQ
jgi:hypothetical protein